MNLEIHHGGNSLNNVANLHVIMAIANTAFFEVLLPHQHINTWREQDLAVGPDGMVRPPRARTGGPIDFTLIERTKTAVLR